MSAKPDFSESIDFDELIAELDQEREHLESGTKLKIVQFTDPLCGWCYGMEPVMTKLRYQLGERLDFSYTMGLMIPSAEGVFGYGFEALQRFNAMKSQIAYGYMMIEQATGMPMEVGRVDRIQPEDISSMEASLGYEAVKLIEGPERAIEFMHAMRQALYAFETSIGSRESVAMLANIFGVDMKAYDAAIESGDAWRLLDDEVQQCRALHVKAFPTFQISYGESSAMISGYQAEDVMANAISYVSRGAVELTQPEYSVRQVMDFLDRFGRVAGEELRCAFSLTWEGLVQAVGKLKDEGLVDIIPSGHSFFIERAR